MYKDQQNTFAKPVRWLLYASLLWFLSACSSLSYYKQAIEGQVELLQKRRPLIEVIEDTNVDAVVRERLQLVQQARSYAVNELMLPDNDSYKDYADLGRPYVMWSVFVTPAYSLKPIQWCYPLLGCIGYKSYFSKGQAQLFADSMRAKDNDVYIAGVPAYSTLGWFDDPVINTMMHWQDYDLVGTLFHELAHQKFYVKNETVFNESLAKTIEQVGLQRWMQLQKQTNQYEQYLLEAEREKAFIQLVLGTRHELEDLYQTSISRQEMFLGKMKIFRSMRSAYLQLRQQWGGHDSYDHWVLSGVNNAKVQSIATYYDYVPAFENILIEQGGDLNKFYSIIDGLIEKTIEDRRTYLEGYLTEKEN